MQFGNAITPLYAFFVIFSIAMTAAQQVNGKDECIHYTFEPRHNWVDFINIDHESEMFAAHKWDVDHMIGGLHYYWSVYLSNYGQMTLESKGFNGGPIVPQAKFKFTIHTSTGDVPFWLDAGKDCSLEGVDIKYADIQSISVERLN